MGRKIKMQKKLIGIFICTLLITTIIPVTGQITKNIINKHTDEVISPLSINDKWMKKSGFINQANKIDSNKNIILRFNAFLSDISLVASGW